MGSVGDSPMKVTDYDAFVRRTDQNKHGSEDDRQNIALYGLVGEIGSLMSAIKKQLLATNDAARRSLATDEIVEELGDIIWYCFAVAQAYFPKGNVNILNNEIAFLRRMITSTHEKYAEFKQLLGLEKATKFLEAYKRYPKTEDLCFDDFQKLAFETARTDGTLLRQVCLSVLWQHGAELLRLKLPESERLINKKIAERPMSYVLGDIAWHVSAVASVYGLSLDEIILHNVKKIENRFGRGPPTKLYDDSYTVGERFPRQFSVSFISIGHRKSRMYLNGRALGDDLTDNAIDNDGYRFHDVMHLANVANLGWSPVLRDLLKLKRKSDPAIDEVQDGARARIVEEAVIKAIHSEGVRLAKERHVGPLRPDRQDIFPNVEDISFGFLKLITSLVANLEVEESRYWEWEEAILGGYRLFHQLRVHEQGTVRIDLEARTLVFEPEVHPDFPGAVSGLGTAVVDAAFRADGGLNCHDVINCVKRAILSSLDLDGDDEAHRTNLEVTMLGEGRPSVRAQGAVKEQMWRHSVVCFRTSFARTGATDICTALAIADPPKK